MKAAFLVSARKIEIEEMPIPEIRENEVLVRVRTVGVCGSDVHYFKNGRIGDQIIKGKFIIGHEVAGEVADTGSRTGKFKTGDRVVIEPSITCGGCEFCLKGKPNLCPHVKFLGTPPVMGAMREYLAMPENNLIKLPASATFDDGVLSEPLAIGLYGVRLSGMKVGDTVAILGAGPIGLSVLFSCRMAGASRIHVTEVIPERAEMAKKLGADFVYPADRLDSTAEILKNTGGRGVDITYECAGKQDTVKQVINTTVIGGRVAIFGITAEDRIEFEPHTMRRKELTIYNVRRSAFTTETALTLMARKNPDFSCLVTHRFTLEKYQEALELVENYADGVIKAVISL